MRRIPLVLIVCAAVTLLLSFGIRQSFGLFLEPMTTSLGVSRTAFALAIAIQNLLWGLSQPLFGALADRFGVVRALLLGGALYIAGLLIMALSGSEAGLYLGAGLLIGLGVSGTSFSLVLAAVARATVPERRSLALGLVSAGGSFGQFAIPLLSQGLIDGNGWLVGLLILAACAGLMVPCAFGLARADAGHEQTASTQSLGQALREAARHNGYWLLNAGFFVCGFHVAFIATHLPAYLASLDFGAMLGAWALATIGLFNIIGTFVAGFLGGRHRKKNVLSGLYLARSLVFTLFLLVPPSQLSILLTSAAMGLLWLGTVPLTGGLVGEIFGPRYMATLFSIVMMSHQIGAFFGAWIGGYVFDLTGSYDIAWQIAIVLGVLSAALHLPIPDRPLRFEHESA
ncbi:MAG: MFS transporter [Acidiferrobacterales bacterium]|nr:MFS transporter [Acidiferrobacterales bacterium]